MSDGGDNPLRQLAAAWEAATSVAAEWAERTAAVTSEAFQRTATVTSEAVQKLVSDPAIRAVLEGWRISPLWSRQDCECLCAISHPDDRGVCDHHAVITRRISDQEVPLCAPCAVAQGVAEQSR
ncbi:MAG TPA: hypothetical protein VE464_23380 [Streptosporangiaceae bacterium]|nr:hypothetical protein [Streptosporangiaceae bacterium]